MTFDFLEEMLHQFERLMDLNLSNIPKNKQNPSLYYMSLIKESELNLQLSNCRIEQLV